MMTRPRIKICCISSTDEARMAVRVGASALGFVSAMPSGPGVITEELIATIVATVPPPIATFLLTSKTTPKEIVAAQHRCRVNTLQLCDRVEFDVYSELRKALPGVSLVQAIHVTGEESLVEAMHVAKHVDALLLDSGNQSLAVKELGGTGRTHDWNISARIATDSPKPVFLAGGLNVDNIGEAVKSVGPFGVDVCSSVRTAGVLDEARLVEFVAAV